MVHYTKIDNFFQGYQGFTIGQRPLQSQQSDVYDLSMGCDTECSMNHSYVICEQTGEPRSHVNLRGTLFQGHLGQA